jgi:hypothetical protein
MNSLIATPMIAPIGSQSRRAATADDDAEDPRLSANTSEVRASRSCLARALAQHEEHDQVRDETDAAHDEHRHARHVGVVADAVDRLDETYTATPIRRIAFTAASTSRR